MFKHTTLWLVSLGALIVAFALGVGALTFLSWIRNPEDSWDHFNRGGAFYTTPPSISSDFSRVVFSTTVRGRGDVGISESGTGRTAFQGDSNLVDTSPAFTDERSSFVFLRESRGNRHLWLSETETGRVRQITTGNEWDYIMDADPATKRLLVMKGDVRGGGYGRGGETWCIELDESPRQVRVGQYAFFTSRGIVYTDSENQNSIYLNDSTTGAKRQIGNGHLVGVSQRRGLVIAGTEEYDTLKPSNQLDAISVLSSVRRPLGKGQTAVVFDDDSAVLIRGFDGQVVFVDADGSEVTIATAPGPKQLYEHALSGSAMLYQRNGPATTGTVWKFDLNTRQFNKFLEVP